MMSLRDTNTTLLRLLGITQPHITALQIHMQPDDLPKVTMRCLLDVKAMQPEVSHFYLVLRDEPKPASKPAPRQVLDLDAMCAAALTQLTAEVQHRASMAIADQYRESAVIRTRLGKTTARHSTACAKALAKLDMACAPRPPIAMQWHLQWERGRPLTGLGGLSQ